MSILLIYLRKLFNIIIDLINIFKLNYYRNVSFLLILCCIIETIQYSPIFCIIVTNAVVHFELLVVKNKISNKITNINICL